MLEEIKKLGLSTMQLNQVMRIVNQQMIGRYRYNQMRERQKLLEVIVEKQDASIKQLQKQDLLQRMMIQQVKTLEKKVQVHHEETMIKQKEYLIDWVNHLVVDERLRRKLKDCINNEEV